MRAGPSDDGRAPSRPRGSVSLSAEERRGLKVLIDRERRRRLAEQSDVLLDLDQMIRNLEAWELTHRARACDHCGTTFWPLSGRHRFCSQPCARRAERARKAGPQAVDPMDRPDFDVIEQADSTDHELVKDGREEDRVWRRRGRWRIGQPLKPGRPYPSRLVSLP